MGHRRERYAAFKNRYVVLVSMLYKTNIFAMVTLSDDDAAHDGLNKVQIWDDLKGAFVGELRSRYEVKGIALRREIIAMVCEDSIYVYTCDKLRVILHLTTCANPRGLCVLAVSSDPWILCCPGQLPGAIRIQVGQSDSATHVIKAHESPLAALAVTASGSLVASASEWGTVVKLFRSSDGQLLYRLRRSMRPAAVSSLAFRSDDRFLAVAGPATVHIFKLDPSTGHEFDAELPSAGEDAAASEGEAVTGSLLLYFNDMRSCAIFRIPDMDSSGEAAVDVRSAQARIKGPQVAFHPTEPKLLVLHYSGVLYESNFSPDHDPRAGAMECGLTSATTWFAVRHDFKVQGMGCELATVAGGSGEGNEEADKWQLL
eukprot:NODE_968_length_1288_cov_315.959448.p1 GENE.NODE_968_length_1288_cov_315.959448~~NODE_968_length_1288_cov_315.959448.p1  ORF type:complete len:372 (+),score=71.60 NODE_968_length_1288_cov_315.959448:3-1118(+)